MAKVSFSKSTGGNPAEAPAVDVEVVEPAQSVPTTPVGQPESNPNTAIARLSDLAPTAMPWDEEKINISDIYLPKINLVHNVGELMTIFNPGEVVLNASTAIHTPAQPQKKIDGNPPLNLTVVGIVKRQFVEKKKQEEGDSERGALVDSLAEVVALGGTINYKEWEHRKKAHLADNKVPMLKRFEPYDTVLVFIEKPAHIPDEEHLVFPHCFNGKYYVMALWGTKGTAYTRATKEFYTAKKIGALQAGYATRSWDFTTALESIRGVPTPVWCPVVKIGPANSLEFIAFMKSVIGCAS